MLVSRTKLRRIDDVLRARLRAFGKNRQGTAAIEFAMVGVPFFALLFFIFELALVFVVSTMLQNGLTVATRAIRTGTFQHGGTPTAANFVSQICANMGWLQSSCLSQLKVDVRTETGFANQTAPDPMASGSFDSSALTFNPGTAGQIVLVRAFYQWPLFVPGLNGMLSQTNNGVRVLVQTTTFANEPFQ